MGSPKYSEAVKPSACSPYNQATDCDKKTRIIVP
jgi:hypothetical protein